MWEKSPSQCRGPQPTQLMVSCLTNGDARVSRLYSNMPINKDRTGTVCGYRSTTRVNPKVEKGSKPSQRVSFKDFTRNPSGIGYPAINEKVPVDSHWQWKEKASIKTPLTYRTTLRLLASKPNSSVAGARILCQSYIAAPSDPVHLHLLRLYDCPHGSFMAFRGREHGHEVDVFGVK